MYEFHYNDIQDKDHNSSRRLFTDIDSLENGIKT